MTWFLTRAPEPGKEPRLSGKPAVSTIRPDIQIVRQFGLYLVGVEDHDLLRRIWSRSSATLLTLLTAGDASTGDVVAMERLCVSAAALLPLSVRDARKRIGLWRVLNTESPLQLTARESQRPCLFLPKAPDTNIPPIDTDDYDTQFSRASRSSTQEL
ncbi:hypothetical protein CSAL01_05354 [Colletotrichum salicis]|uniref:Uncharacterized protein n=1 Tax=Colletotrichum salicis TaxID=1209931 RepID=A0A135TZA4_9PEZI|nr:hypothetical protein CSAL01_05354 [Colletotrichum salicis]